MKITKLLQCITASLLLVSCGSRTRDIPKSDTDSEYLDLIKQAEELSASSAKWNEKCGEHPFSEDCKADQQVMSSLWSAYIIRAIKYKTEGNDCSAEMRTKVINFNVQIALFNVKCAGQDHTKNQEIDCVAESAFIEQNRVDLHDQMAACREQIHGSKQ